MSGWLRPSGERIQPVALIALHSRHGDLERLYRFFAEWEVWTAEILESHLSYPMLAYFRSQHAGQSWVTALGVVLDAATLTAACVHGAEDQEPYLMYRRGRRAVEEISLRLQGAAYGQELAESRAVRFATHGPAAARCRRRLGPPATPPEPDRLSGGAGWILGSLGGVALAHR